MQDPISLASLLENRVNPNLAHGFFGAKLTYKLPKMMLQLSGTLTKMTHPPLARLLELSRILNLTRLQRICTTRLTKAELTVQTKMLPTIPHGR